MVVVVVETPCALRDEARKRLQSDVQEAFGSETKVLVLDQGAKLKVFGSDVNAMTGPIISE